MDKANIIIRLLNTLRVSGYMIGGGILGSIIASVTYDIFNKNKRTSSLRSVNGICFTGMGGIFGIGIGLGYGIKELLIEY